MSPRTLLSRRRDVADPAIPGDADPGLSYSERFPALWISIALVAAVVMFSIATDMRFASATNFSNIMLDASQIVILAVPMTYIITTAGIDLSVGATLILSSVIAADVMGRFSGTAAQVEAFEFPHAGLGIALGAIAGILVGALAGAVNGFFIAYAKLPAFVVTLATMGMYRGIAQILTDGTNNIYIPTQLQEGFGSAQLFGVVPYPVLLAAVVALLGWWVLRWTRRGIHTLAIGANLEGTRRVGVKVDRHIFVLYTVAGACAGVAGLIDLARFTATSIEGHTTDNLDAISAVVIGGTSLFGGIGNIPGTIVGSLFPSVLRNGLVQMHLPPFWQPVILGAVLLAAIAYDTVRRRKG